MSALFDFNQVVTRTGTLAELDWRSPHIYMLVDVDDAGKVAGRSKGVGPDPTGHAERRHRRVGVPAELLSVAARG